MLPDDVERVVKSCARCAATLAKPVREPLKPWPEAKKPWSRIHMDFAEPTKGNMFLVVADSYSRYLDAHWIKPATAPATVQYLRSLFRHFGAPETIVTDNGTQFTSTEFAQMGADLDIVHLRSPPGMPQSNGFAERMVQTVKKALDKATPNLDLVVTTNLNYFNLLFYRHCYFCIFEKYNICNFQINLKNCCNSSN